MSSSAIRNMNKSAGAVKVQPVVSVDVLKVSKPKKMAKMKYGSKPKAVDPEILDEELQEGNKPKMAKAIASGKMKDPDVDTGSALSMMMRKGGKY